MFWVEGLYDRSVSEQYVLPELKKHDWPVAVVAALNPNLVTVKLYEVGQFKKVIFFRLVVVGNFRDLCEHLWFILCLCCWVDEIHQFPRFDLA